jgi:hypothetical protein
MRLHPDDIKEIAKQVIDGLLAEKKARKPRKAKGEAHTEAFEAIWSIHQNGQGTTSVKHMTVLASDYRRACRSTTCMSGQKPMRHTANQQARVVSIFCKPGPFSDATIGLMTIGQSSKRKKPIARNTRYQHRTRT